MEAIRQNERDRLEYVAAMLAELRRMTSGDELGMLSYLIEMAYLEARSAAEGKRDTRRGDKRDAVA